MPLVRAGCSAVMVDNDIELSDGDEEKHKTQTNFKSETQSTNTFVIVVYFV
jgi:hypothetical protein